MAVPPPPMIEGSLKTTINSIGFGLITAVLAVNFGRLLAPNFFVWIVVTVVIIEVILLALTKKREDYEVYQAPGRKVRHTVGGNDVPQITVDTVDDATHDTPKKKGIRGKLRPHKRESKAGIECTEEGMVSTSAKRLSPMIEHKAALEANVEKKAEKKQEKAEEKAIEKEEKAKEKEEKAREKVKGKTSESGDRKARESEGEDGGKDKKIKRWKSRLHRKSQGDSDES
ncbi:DEK domain-containing chromatin-associated protein 3-like [Nematostella vectensis]|uniref:DEK domain-containing chromatin-associated protein 3-like n=1 Tax=Nematostella vectensis TaxID=45351 RepID=UPI0020772458|nr:DEK domain-containing chromatin-associated protein 3-like [Nematostella vectensis]